LQEYTKADFDDSLLLADMRPRCRPPAHLMDPWIVAAFNASAAKFR
jgi:hypothetical protein